jgi:ABC-2 type transport system ATP-binding protein
MAAREHTGTVPEEANVYADLTVWQNLMLMGELHGVPRPRRIQRGKELLSLFGLGDRAQQKGRALSKGLRQRLMLCMALVSDPTVLFLDEPTTGLDVASTRLIRELVVRMNRQEGTTIFLTTHNIQEADQLCHRVAIINTARIAAIDTPAALRGQFEALRSVEVTFTKGCLDAEKLSALDTVTQVKPLTRGARLFTPEPGRVAQEIACLAQEMGATIESIRTGEPALEDIFLRITESSSTRKKDRD